MYRQPPRSTRTDTLFPYTTLFRSNIRPRPDEITHDRPRGVALDLLLQLREVGHRRDRDDLFEQVRRQNPRLQRRIAAIGPADDRQPGGVGSLFHPPATGIGHIANRGAPPLESIFLITSEKRLVGQE